jgi:hypothetical protein
VSDPVAAVGMWLSRLHQTVGGGTCVDWLTTTSLAGLLIGLVPVMAAVLVVLLRRAANDRGAMVPVQLGVAVLGAGVLPGLAVSRVAEVYRRAANGGTPSATGLTRADLVSLHTRCALPGSGLPGVRAVLGFLPNDGTLPPASDYLGNSAPASTALSQLGSAGAGTPLVLFGLVVVPLAALAWVMLLGRTAYRRGRRLGFSFYVPAALAGLACASVTSTVLSTTLIGFSLSAAGGCLVVRLLGTPSGRPAAGPAPEQQRPTAGPPGPSRGDQRRQRREEERSRQLAALDAQAVQAQQAEQAERARQAGLARLARPGANGTGQYPPPPYPPSRSPAGPARTALAPSMGLPAARPGPPMAATPGPLPIPGPAGRPPVSGMAPRPVAADRFRRLRKLGEGGFGAVYLALDTRLDRQVAIKTARVDDPETRERIRREARALAAVRHPNCVRVHDILEEPGGLSLVMEVVTGGSLTATVRERGTLDDAAAARLWAALAGALHAAHQVGVLHRDVTPSNVLLDDEGEPRLIDFGIARSDTDPSVTATGFVVGTPDYLAPEVAAGAAASRASDTWQLAATMAYAMSGSPPRGSRETPVAALLAAAHGEPCVAVPPYSAHADLLYAALDPQPGRRPDLPVLRARLLRWLEEDGRRNGRAMAATGMLDSPTRPVGPRRPPART